VCEALHDELKDNGGEEKDCAGRASTMVCEQFSTWGVYDEKITDVPEREEKVALVIVTTGGGT